MNNKELPSKVARHLYQYWCWWRLYSRLPQRILYHDGEPRGANFQLALGRAAGLYCFFEASFWLLFLLIPLGRLFSIGQWLVCYMAIVILLVARDFLMWGWLDDTKALKDCNQLREQGYWYPDKMTSGPLKKVIWITIFVFLQILLAPTIIIGSFILFH